jgi:LuxR family maltose regulon positive regulatory protein
MLGGPARVTLVSAPAGSGKTVLLRSWVSHAGLAERAAWVTAGRDERDPQRFWLSVLGALHGTAAGSALVQGVSAAPDLDGWALVERLLKDLAPLGDPVWLVIDDVHELGATEALRQLQLLVMRAPPELRFVLATRHDLRLGLHRLRLQGELAEIRGRDLRFSLADARALFAASGVELPESAVVLLHERTEGWASGLRLAALSLAGHPDPARFAAEFSGSERTVAKYLVAEVLDRQSEPVRRLLLRTSILERVNGELADLLTGGDGGERVLQDLEQANAFVVSLDASRSWFRYHQMFAELLQLELRRTAQGEVTALHHAAVGWFAGHGYPVEAIRHAQAAQGWGLAAGLLADYWPGLQLGGQAGAVRDLLAGFPAATRAADAELATLSAGEELASGSLEDAQRHLEEGLLLARRIGRPFLEFSGLAYQAVAGLHQSPFGPAAERGRQAIELAQRHGWTDEPAAGLAYMAIAGSLAWQGKPEKAEPWAERAERTVKTEAEPAARLAVHYLRGRLELARGRYQEALTAFRAADRLAGRLDAPNPVIARTRIMLVYVLVRLGDTEGAEQALAYLGEQDRESAAIGVATAELRLAQDDPGAATVALAPVLDGMPSQPTPVPPDDLSRKLTVARPDRDQSLPHIGLVRDTYTFLVTGEETAGKYTLIDMRVPPGGGPPPHRHDFEEMFTVLDGEVQVTFRGETLTARAGGLHRQVAGARARVQDRTAPAIRRK